MKLRILFSSLALLLIPFSMEAATISPATLDLQASKGETVSSTFTVINTSASEQKYYLDTLGFQPRDESGVPQFLDKDKSSAFTKWIQFSNDQVTVPARSKVEVPFQILVPSDVGAGNQEVAITVSSAPSDVVATNGAIIEAKTAMLVFLTIKGDTIKQAGLLDFVDAIRQQVRSELVGTFSYRIQNQGNVYAIPVGTIQMKDLFGRILQKADANSSGGRILPNSTRKFEVSVGTKQNGFIDQIKNQMQMIAVGPITSELSIDLGDGFKAIHAQTTFWYIPYQLIGTILIAFLLLLLLYKSFSKKH